MKTCEFSETQFSFCFTFEYIERFGPFPIPTFLNTVLEGRLGGGYDVRIDSNRFFQYKIPSFHDTPSNFHRKYWDAYNAPYYKIKIDTNSKQYKLLKDLAEDDPSNLAYYATPEFITNSGMTAYYKDSEIVQRSAIFPVLGMPNHGSGHHHLIYTEASTDGWLLSEPIKITREYIYKTEVPPSTQNEEKYLHSTANTIKNVLLRNSENLDTSVLRDDTNSHTLAMNVRHFLLIHFNIHWHPTTSLLSIDHRFQLPHIGT